MDDLIPRDKGDHERVDKVKAAGYPAVAPILGPLLGWVVDGNWPIAGPLGAFLRSIGAPMAPHIQAIFDTDDWTAKYFVIVLVVTGSPELTDIFRPCLERLVREPTPQEREECLHEVAEAALSVPDAR